ncbi:MAG: (2Fe-2S)-binding protein [Gammaproteobacteria bacterium]
MYVCLCRGVTDSEIKEAISQGTRTFQGLCQQLGVAQQCGKCDCEVKEMLLEFAPQEATQLESETIQT